MVFANPGMHMGYAHTMPIGQRPSALASGDGGAAQPWWWLWQLLWRWTSLLQIQATYVQKKYQITRLN